MESKAMPRVFLYDDFFFSLLGVQFVQRKSPNSAYELRLVKLITLSSLTIFAQSFSMLMKIVSLLALSSHFDLLEVSEAVAVYSAAVLAFVRGFALLAHQKVVNRLLAKLERYFPITSQDQLKHNLGLYANATILRNKVMKTLCTFVAITFLGLPILQSLFGWMVRGHSYSYQYAFSGWYPFDENQSISYPFVYCFHVASTVCGVWLLFSEDVIFSTSVSQLCMHYRYLCELFGHIDARVQSRNYKDLRLIVQYQYALESIRKDVDEIFSLSTFICFTVMKITICMFTFTIVHGHLTLNMLPFVISCLSLLLPVYMRCANGTDLYEASAKLLDSIYEHNWYEGTPRYRNMVVITMMRALHPIELQASKINHIGVTYFKEIVMATYQIFMFLHNVGN